MKIYPSDHGNLPHLLYSSHLLVNRSPIILVLVCLLATNLLICAPSRFLVLATARRSSCRRLLSSSGSWLPNGLFKKMSVSHSYHSSLIDLVIICPYISPQHRNPSKRPWHNSRGKLSHVSPKVLMAMFREFLRVELDLGCVEEPGEMKVTPLHPSEMKVMPLGICTILNGISMDTC